MQSLICVVPIQLDLNSTRHGHNHSIMHFIYLDKFKISFCLGISLNNNRRYIITNAMDTTENYEILHKTQSGHDSSKLIMGSQRGIAP